ncbi:PadR family transcriptional regulator, regulatory protein PadR [Hathewaya proteolytica DSM 3090]|uniref:PadR family transcriptional regulator, regulatory protein PadR n=1 Tax=Hathewaya proteolytica DSM 3090 TaxID=1121331 RepID=A0A1M6PWY1_9CLOT|nr:PadR family transcriptional regulator [Hathewaya proteolytica]SHK12421.1 PadR family transcriptional regulator, regulatory protein PadR [Hathewaya proteolytica DSM 3090]
MDVQLKRGFLEACVLATLMKGDSYGYQLVKEISQCTPISESTLYPILRRMESNDMVVVYAMEYNSRLRKYYRITQGGIDRLQQFREEWKEILKIYEFIEENSGGDDRSLIVKE